MKRIIAQEFQVNRACAKEVWVFFIWYAPCMSSNKRRGFPPLQGQRLKSVPVKHFLISISSKRPFVITTENP